MDRDATFSTRRLVSEFPGVIAGPDFPPLSTDSKLCKSRPACGVGPLWQAKQLALKMGRMSVSKPGLLAVLAPERGTTTNKTNHRTSNCSSRRFTSDTLP